MERLGKIAGNLVRLFWVVFVSMLALSVFGTAMLPRGFLTPIARTIIEHRVSNAQANWLAHNIKDFEIDLHYWGGFCFDNSGPYHIEVRHGVVKTIAPNFLNDPFSQFCPPTNSIFWAHHVPPAVFDRILLEVKSSPSGTCPTTVTGVTFDPKVGYPTAISIEGMECGESSSRYNYTNFKPIEP